MVDPGFGLESIIGIEHFRYWLKADVFECHGEGLLLTLTRPPFSDPDHNWFK